MRPTPIPDGEIWDGATRVVVAGPGGDLTDTTIAPVEALIDDVSIGKRFSMRCALEGDDLAVLRSGGVVWVSIYGERLQPFSVDVSGSVSPQLPSLRLDTDMSTGVPRFDLLVSGVDPAEADTFVTGCIEALQQMLDRGGPQALADG